MVRTVEQIKQVILDKITGTPALEELATTFSKVGIWVLFIDVVSYGIWVVENLFDNHRKDIDAELLKKNPHSVSFYKQKALDFQYGYNLVDGTDKYNNTGVSDDLILASKIIAYAAVTESESIRNNKLLLKIATSQNGILQPISNTALVAFKAYINRIKDAGTGINIVNYLPDRLYITANIYYNPLLLDPSGNSIKNGGKPVEDALNAFLKEVGFNGEIILMKMVDKLQNTEGVDIPDLLAVQTSWIDTALNDYGNATPVNVRVVPKSGYFTIVDFSNINYIANV